MTNISYEQIEIALFFRFYIQSDLDLNCFTWKCIHSSSTKNFFVLMFQMFIFTSFTFAKIYFAKSHHVDLSFIVCRCSWDFCYAVEILVNIFFYFGHMISTVKSYQPDIMIKPSEFQIIHMGQKC